MLLSLFVSGEFEPSWHNFHIIEENVKHAGISRIVFFFAFSKLPHKCWVGQFVLVQWEVCSVPVGAGQKAGFNGCL